MGVKVKKEEVAFLAVQGRQVRLRRCGHHHLPGLPHHRAFHGQQLRQVRHAAQHGAARRVRQRAHRARLHHQEEEGRRRHCSAQRPQRSQHAVLTGSNFLHNFGAMSIFVLHPRLHHAHASYRPHRADDRPRVSPAAFRPRSWPCSPVPRPVFGGIIAKAEHGEVGHDLWQRVACSHHAAPSCSCS